MYNFKQHWCLYEFLVKSTKEVGLFAVQMPADERGHKQLGRGHAASHLFQLALVLVLGVLVMAEPWPTTGQWRAVFGGFGIVYALQVRLHMRPLIAVSFPISCFVHNVNLGDTVSARWIGPALAVIICLLL